MTPHSPTRVQQHVRGAPCRHLQSNRWWWRHWRHQVPPKCQ